MSDVTYKIRVNRPCRLFIDDEEVAVLNELELTRFSLPVGEYLRKVVAIDNETIYDETEIVLAGESKLDIITLDLIGLEEIKSELFSHGLVKIGDFYYSSIGGGSLEINRNIDDFYTLPNVVIPERITYKGYLYNVDSIGDRAFSCNENLIFVSIPTHIKHIDNDAFFCCYLCKQNFIYEGRLKNDSFWGIRFIDEDIDGMLIKDNTIIKVRTEVISTSVVIPNHIKEIGDGAFWGCSNIQSIVIPYGVETIGGCAFGFCSQLKEIIIPESVKKIGELPFHCTNSPKIIYDGYIYQFYNIEKTDSYDNDNYSKFIQCLDGEVEVMI